MSRLYQRKQDTGKASATHRKTNSFPDRQCHPAEKFCPRKTLLSHKEQGRREGDQFSLTSRRLGRSCLRRAAPWSVTWVFRRNSFCKLVIELRIATDSSSIGTRLRQRLCSCLSRQIFCNPPIDKFGSSTPRCFRFLKRCKSARRFSSIFSFFKLRDSRLDSWLIKRISSSLFIARLGFNGGPSRLYHLQGEVNAAPKYRYSKSIGIKE